MDGNYGTESNGQNSQNSQGSAGYQNNTGGYQAGQSSADYQNSQYSTYSEYTATSQSQAPAEKEKPNRLQIAGLVCGIVAILMGCCCTPLGIAAGGAGLACAISGNKQFKTTVGTAGLVCSAVGLGFCVIMLIVNSIFSAQYMQVYTDIYTEMLKNMGYY